MFKPFLPLAILGAAAQASFALTYVAGSLTDSNTTNGSGVSSPSGDANLQYSDGSGTPSQRGQIDIADDPADPDWVYDQGAASAVNTVDFWSSYLSTSFSQMPSGTITVYGSSSSSGPWTQIGQVTRSMDRDTTLPNNQALAGEGFRVPCNGSSYRYIRINVVTPGSTGGLDNHWVIRKVEVNKNLVIQHFHRASDGSSVINSGTYVPYNAVDGSTATGWNALSADTYLTLDIGGTARAFKTITLQPVGSNGGYLPQLGQVRVSSNDDPDNMDTVVAIFNPVISSTNTESTQIVLPIAATKRYVQLHWTSVRNSGTETRIGEISVDTATFPPLGTDVTDPANVSGTNASYAVVPNDLSYASWNAGALAAALAHFKYVYLPSNTYYITGTINMPGNSRLRGDGMENATCLRFTNSTSGFYVLGQDTVQFDNMQMDRMSSIGTVAAITVTDSIVGSTTTHSSNIIIDHIKVTSNHSRDAAITLNNVETGAVVNSAAYDTQAPFYDLNGGSTSKIYVWGSGIRYLRGRNGYIHNNHLEETRNMLSTAVTGTADRAFNLVQAGGIEPVATECTVVSNNYVHRYGEAIDINQSHHTLVISNTIHENANSGIKLCNGTQDCWVQNNQIERCGITGIWMTPGNVDVNVMNNFVDSNTCTATGQGIDSSGTNWNGSGYWHAYMGWAPAGISIEDSPDANNQIKLNTVTNNAVLNNSAVATPVSTFGIWVSPGGGGRYDALNNVVTSNTVQPYP